jgi:c-di-GMP-binding flagellar brake protein YcgR
MLDRTFRFWRRLVGRPGKSKGAAAEEAERRVWVRYPANLQTTLQAAQAPEERLSARVGDISRGGIKLVVQRPLQTGELLSVELPCGDEAAQTVLACIVRVEALPDGEWSVGCTFSRELGDDDLEGFGARRVRNDPSDQRLWMRFPCNIRATVQKVASPESPAEAARVLNISATGIGILVPQLIDTGALLSVELQPAGGKEPRTMLACVVHVNPQANGEFALGCNFIRELTEQDLQTLL